MSKRLDEHIYEAFIENVLFLRHECGMNDEQIAKRLEVTPKTLEKRLERSGIAA